MLRLSQCLLLLISTSIAAAQAPQRLELGSGPLERSIAGGEEHAYLLDVEAEQYLHLVAEQRGVDIILRLYGPSGNLLQEFDSPNGDQGPERLHFIAGEAGRHRLLIAPLAAEAEIGAYLISLKAHRSASAGDRQLVSARELLIRANRLARAGNAPSRREAIQLYRESGKLWDALGRVEEAADALRRMAQTLLAEWEFEKAAQACREGLALSPSRSLQASLWYNLGFSQSSLNQVPESSESYRHALKAYEEVGNLNSQAQTLNALAVNYDEWGDSNQAVELYQRALQISLRTGHRRRQCNVLINLGMSLAELGRYQEALDRFAQARPTVDELNDPLLKANLLTNSAVVLWRLGAKEESAQGFERSLSWWEKAGSPSSLSTALTNLGYVSFRLGRSDEALGFLGRSLETSRRLDLAGEEAHALSAIGTLHLSQGQVEKALENFNQSLKLRRRLGHKTGQAIVLGEISKAHSRLGQLEKARALLSEALALARSIGDLRTRASLLTSLAEIELKRGHPQLAQRDAESALEILTRIRRRVASYDLRAAYSSLHRRAYEIQIDALWESRKGRPSEADAAAALEISERSKAKTLLEMLEESRIKVERGIAPQLSRREEINQTRLSRLQSALLVQRSAENPDVARLSSLRRQLAQAESERTRLEREIRRRHPRYAQLRYPQPRSASQIRSGLAADEALLEYVVGEDQSYLIAATRERVIWRRLGPSKRIGGLCAKVRTGLSRPGRRGLNAFASASRELARLLIDPARSLLKGKRSLIVAPDGNLHYLPFEALVVGERRRPGTSGFPSLDFLLRHWAVRYAPSASVLASLESTSARNPDDAGDWDLLALGSPRYRLAQSDDVEGSRADPGLSRSIGGAGWSLDDLPHSKREVEAIAAFFPPERTRILVGEEASEENVKAEEALSSARLVHFSAHGLLREDRPRHSGLALSFDRDPAEDGLLQVYEIFNLKLQADLVVLSSCRSGLGQLLKGEGVLGLTQAFLYAGASGLVTSLWPVEDQSTADLMVALYRRLADGGMPASQALRQAKLEMIDKGGREAQPYHWAGFVLFGRDAQVGPQGSGSGR